MQKIINYTKIFTIVILLIIGSLQSFAVNYTINFTASGACSTVDSVIVKNLTTNSTITVPTGNSLNLVSDVPTSLQSTNDASNEIEK